MAIHESGEMYLETIYILSQKSASVRGIDVGDYMGFSKPSVSRALGLLKKDGFVENDSNGYIKLTSSGEKEAKRIYERHTVLAELFKRLGVGEDVAVEDACKIEHYLSDETFDAIKKHMQKYSGRQQ